MKTKDTDILSALLAAAILGSEEKKEEPKAEISMREKSAKLGKIIHESMLGFMDAGFTEEQAFQIALTIKKGI